MIEPYRIPAETHRIETEVAKSRFIATVSPAATIEEAKAFLASIRAEMPDASHHVYAFRVGYGQTITEGMSDDGEPSGTAGPPVLSILRGEDIGDIAIVVTRYFGGTKLGTGGLVRAYSEATHIALNSLKTELKIEKSILGIEIPYPLFDLTKRLLPNHDAEIVDETFVEVVTIIISIPTANIPELEKSLLDLSNGKVKPVLLD
ncbi:MAG: YigZ family protein [Aggregatilineales bacterium]